MFEDGQKMMKYLLIFLFIVKIGIAQAIPLCAFHKFWFSAKDVLALLAINPPKRDLNDELFIVNIGPKDDSEGGIFIFDKNVI